MQVLLSLLSVCLFVFYGAQATPLKKLVDLTGYKELTNPDLNEKKSVSNEEKVVSENKEVLEDVDFDNDDEDDFNESIYLINLAEKSVNSVRHLHQRKGEILVSCFGMWWPVGGTTYDYIEYYDGDYRRKRRRSKKQKKAARTKKKKS